MVRWFLLINVPGTTDAFGLWLPLGAQAGADVHTTEGCPLPKQQTPGRIWEHVLLLEKNTVNSQDQRLIYVMAFEIPKLRQN